MQLLDLVAPIENMGIKVITGTPAHIQEARPAGRGFVIDWPAGVPGFDATAVTSSSLGDTVDQATARIARFAPEWIGLVL